jgi:hypothetical protein
MNGVELITARRKVEDSHGFVRAVASEAKRRGYTYVGNKETEARLALYGRV